MTAGVSDGHAFETMVRARLPAWIARQLDATDVELLDLERLAGGFSNEIWKVECRYRRTTGLAEMTFVLRAEIEGGVSAPYDIPGQFALLQILAETAIPLPRPLWLEADKGVLGQAFLTMEPVGGITGTRLIPLDDPLLDRKRQSYVDALAVVHGLDWRNHGIDTVLAVPPGEDSVGAEIAIETARMERMGHGSNPDALRAVAWLNEHRPDDCEVALIHGDCNMANYRFGTDGSVLAVLDWEAARLSDPHWDVATYVRMIPRYYKDETPAIQQREKETFLTMYRETTGRALDHLAFWEGLYAFSAAMKAEHPAFASNWSPIYWDQVRLLTAH